MVQISVRHCCLCTFIFPQSLLCAPPASSPHLSVTRTSGRHGVFFGLEGGWSLRTAAAVCDCVVVWRVWLCSVWSHRDAAIVSAQVWEKPNPEDRQSFSFRASERWAETHLHLLLSPPEEAPCPWKSEPRMHPLGWGRAGREPTWMLLQSWGGCCLHRLCILTSHSHRLILQRHRVHRDAHRLHDTVNTQGANRDTFCMSA